MSEPFLCRFGFHRWRHVGHFDQWRRCERCQRTQMLLCLGFDVYEDCPADYFDRAEERFICKPAQDEGERNEL